jgi:hypothetical protein
LRRNRTLEIHRRRANPGRRRFISGRERAFSGGHHPEQKDDDRFSMDDDPEGVEIDHFPVVTAGMDSSMTEF